VNDFVRQKMKADNIYDEFVDIIEVSVYAISFIILVETLIGMA
jgi:hypothetical protein